MPVSSDKMSLVIEPSATTNWYRDAVFYMLPVRSYFDGNGDGIGDFLGLESKLDYLEELGITCIWLLPYYPSPWRDDGYDVSDYRDVHPSYGSMDDFRRFLENARRRRLRVIAELPISHTAVDHPWFQTAQRAPTGSALRNFYVWRGPQPDGVSDATNLDPHWTWSEVAAAEYWHPFAAHQPGLNLKQPEVREEMLKVMRFWLDQGLDGLCLNGTGHAFNFDDSEDDRRRKRMHC